MEDVDSLLKKVQNNIQREIGIEFNKEEARKIFKAVNQSIQEHLLDGYNVRLSGLAYFRLSTQRPLIWLKNGKAGSKRMTVRCKVSETLRKKMGEKYPYAD